MEGFFSYKERHSTHTHDCPSLFFASPYESHHIEAVWVPACNMIRIRRRWGTRCQGRTWRQRRTWRQGHAPKFDRYVAGLEGLCFEKVKVERKVMSR